jgi:hypothetical protein
VGLIKTADQILQGRPRPTDRIEPGSLKGKGGRPPLHRGCKLKPKGCDRPHWGHGYCRPHGRAYLLYGDAEARYKRPPKCLCQQCPVHAPDNVPMRKKTKHSG